jgi:ElaB/YqjD/DUF883 family membrane-anchored ribosome-binding protein
MAEEIAMPIPNEADPTELVGTRGAEFNHLFDSVDDLLKRVADIESGDIQKVRAKVRVALMAAKSAWQDGASQVLRPASHIGDSAEDYVHSNPWQSAGLATLVGAALGLVVARRTYE